MQRIRGARSTVLIVLSIVGVAACGVDDGDEAVAAGDETTITERETTTTTRPTTTTTTAPEPEDLVLEDIGFTSAVNSIDARYTTAGALVTNPNDDLAAYDFDLVFNLLDTNGVIADTETVQVEYIPPGETVPVAPSLLGFDSRSEPANIEFDAVGWFDYDIGWDGVEGFMMGLGIDLDVSDEAFQPDERGPTVGFTATNPSEEVIEYGSWHCVLRSGGSIVGGETGWIMDTIPPNGSVRVDTRLSVATVAADETICRANG